MQATARIVSRLDRRLIMGLRPPNPNCPPESVDNLQHSAREEQYLKQFESQWCKVYKPALGKETVPIVDFSPDVSAYFQDGHTAHKPWPFNNSWNPSKKK
jgi:hypothetical protein